jgi:hypothetical protein
MSQEDDKILKQAFKLLYECSVIRNLSLYGIRQEEQMDKLKQLILDNNKEIFND